MSVARTLLVGLLLSCVPAATRAELPTVDGPTQAKRGLALWRCAVLQAVRDRPDDDLNNLFHSGYSDLTGALTQYLDVESKWQVSDYPIEFVFLVRQAPTLEFRLGIMWASVQAEILAKIRSIEAKEGVQGGSGTAPVVASQLFDEMNCQFLLPQP